MDKRELDQHLDELWERLHGAGSEPLRLPRAEMESVLSLKRRFEEEILRWQEMVELKEKALADLQKRLVRAESGLAKAEERSREAESILMHQTVQSGVELEGLQKSFQSQKEISQKEIQSLTKTGEQLKRQLASEESKLRRFQEAWAKKAQEYASKTAELESLSREMEKKILEGEGRLSSERLSLSQAREALQNTLQELLNERQNREEAGRLLADAGQKASQLEARILELESQIQGMQAAWEAERRQWRELWERERSAWELQRQEFIAWEERLRKERESWHEDLRKKEKEEVDFASQMVKVMKESALWVSKLKEALSSNFVVTHTLTLEAENRSKFRKWAGILLAGASAAAVLASAVWFFKQIHLKSQGSFPIDAVRPTSLAYDGRLLWIADWEGPWAAVDSAKPSELVHKAPMSALAPYHPSAMAYGAGSFWSLDMGQSRIIQHSAEDPSRAVLAFPAFDVLPTAIAHDGQRLWSYGAGQGLLIRYALDPRQGAERTYLLPENLTPSSMFWIGGELWIFDSSRNALFRFKVKKDSFKKVSSRKMDPSLVGVAVFGRTLWGLAKPSSPSESYTLRKYRILP